MQMPSGSSKGPYLQRRDTRSLCLQPTWCSNNRWTHSEIPTTWGQTPTRPSPWTTATTCRTIASCSQSSPSVWAASNMEVSLVLYLLIDVFRNRDPTAVSRIRTAWQHRSCL
jgi:hypothetical protein